MKYRIRRIGLLLLLAFGVPCLQAGEPQTAPQKKAATKKPADTNAPRQPKHKLRATSPKSKALRNSLPSYVAPDPKMLGLGCASGED